MPPLPATGASDDTLADTSKATRKARVLTIAAALERTSTHPLAAAVAAAAIEAPAATGIDRDLPVTDDNQDPGHGLTGVVDEQPVRVDGPRGLEPGPPQPKADAMVAARTGLIVVQAEAKTVAVIGVRDELPPDAPPALRELHEAGVRTVTLTGDSPQTAHALAHPVGITDVRAGLCPRTRPKQSPSSARSSPPRCSATASTTHPPLAAATVGIAMGATGSAAAVEAADVAFTGHDLRLLTRAVRHALHGRRGRTIMIRTSASPW
ncbi:HAD family hydrolase [Terrabacter sp. C0L_2]|uniref:HAD family hydrolase n=1 Tax=Terrabacter sp. C0L_2 TaxID=3108389 RepID=UPI0017E1D062|nr:HAD family hydrolase [Dermatophilaceae bacterium]NUR14867.1 HAD family hydrolase [Dermatophilaceae bacterium]WVM95442.1 HAD family hydrolase [Terrabacter sp. C0L_2]